MNDLFDYFKNQINHPSKFIIKVLLMDNSGPYYFSYEQTDIATQNSRLMLTKDIYQAHVFSDSKDTEDIIDRLIEEAVVMHAELSSVRIVEESNPLYRQ